MKDEIWNEILKKLSISEITYLNEKLTKVDQDSDQENFTCYACKYCKVECYDRKDEYIEL